MRTLEYRCPIRTIVCPVLFAVLLLTTAISAQAPSSPETGTTSTPPTDRGTDSTPLQKKIRGWWQTGTRRINDGNSASTKRCVRKLARSDSRAKKAVARLLLVKHHLKQKQTRRARKHLANAHSAVDGDEDLTAALKPILDPLRKEQINVTAKKYLKKGRTHIQNGRTERLRTFLKTVSDHPSRRIRLLKPLLRIRYHVHRKNKKKAVARMEWVVQARENMDVNLPAPAREELQTLQNRMGDWQVVRRRARKERADSPPSSGSSSTAGDPAGPSPKKLVKRGLKLIRRGHLKPVLRRLRSLPAEASPKQKVAHRLLGARLQARRGRTGRSRTAFKNAKATLKQTETSATEETCCGADTKIGNLAPPFRMALAAGYRDVTGDRMKTLEIYDRIGRKNDDMKRVYAAEGMSDTFMKMGVPTSNIRKAYRWIKYALDHLSYLSARAGDSADSEETEVIGEQLGWKQQTTRRRERTVVRRRLTRKKREIRRLLDILDHGLGFWLYKRARNAQLNGHAKKAVARWTKLIERARTQKDNTKEEVIQEGERVRLEQLKKLPVSPIYREAARVYREQCRIRQGKYKKALAGLQQFVEKASGDYRLYEGEALRTMGDVALEHLYRPNKAIEYYTRAVEWFENVRDHDREVASYTVPDKARGVTRPPKKFRTSKGLGRGVWTDPDPGDVLNRKRSGWYIPYNRMMAKTHRSLCYFVLSFYSKKESYREKALEDIQVIKEVDPVARELTRQNRASNYLRLRDGYRLGKLFSTKPEQRAFKGDRRLFTALMIADMHYEMEQWGKALTAYRRLINRFAGGDRGSLPQDQQAYLTYVIGNCHAMQGREDKGQKMLETFLDRYQNTPTWPRVMLTLDNYYAFSSKKYKVLKMVYNRMPDTKYGERALMTLGQWRYTREDYEKAKKYFRKLEEEAERENNAVTARTYLKHIKHIQEKTSP